jgi:hypothetical protein
MEVVSAGRSGVLDEGGQGNERCCGHYGEHESTIISIKKNYDQWKRKDQSFLCKSS